MRVSAGCVWRTDAPAGATIPTMRTFESVAVALLVSALGLGCGDDAVGSVETDAGPGATEDDAGTTTETPRLLEHTFEPFDVAPGEEIAWTCQSWTLGNSEPIWVTTVEAENDGGWHHSNWFFVPESSFRGPDGTWGCSERGFNEVAAAVAGGVLFAQSTQSLTDLQELPPGTALRLPPRTRIVGNVHLLNVTPTPIEDTAISLRLHTVPEEEVETTLRPMSFTNLALDLPPRAETRFSMECDIDTPYQDRFGHGADFSIYYVLPHYHELANYFSLELVGGDRDGEVIFQTGAAVGEPLGQTLSPPLDVTGAHAIRMTCGYDNPRDESVGYGIGDQEMCVFLAFTDSPYRFGASAEDNTYLGEADGIHMNDTRCELLSIAGR